MFRNLEEELKKACESRLIHLQSADGWKDWFSAAKIPAPATIFQDFRANGSKTFHAELYTTLLQQNSNASFFALVESEADAVAAFLKNFDQHQHGFKVVSMHSVVEINPRLHVATKKSPKSNFLMLFRFVIVNFISIQIVLFQIYRNQ